MKRMDFEPNVVTEFVITYMAFVRTGENLWRSILNVILMLRPKFVIIIGFCEILIAR